MKTTKNAQGFYMFSLLGKREVKRLCRLVKLTDEESKLNALQYSTFGLIPEEEIRNRHTKLVRMVSTRILKKHGEKYNFKFCDDNLRMSCAISTAFEQEFKYWDSRSTGSYDIIHVFAAWMEYQLSSNKNLLKRYKDLISKRKKEENRVVNFFKDPKNAEKLFRCL